MDLKRIFVLTLFLGIFCPAFCCGDTLHYRLYFPVGSSTPDLSYRDNGVRLDSLLSGIRSRQAHSVLPPYQYALGIVARGQFRFKQAPVR